MSRLYPSVEVRHSHGRRRAGREAINFCEVFVDDFWLIANQPLTTDGEAAEALALFNARFLKYWEAATACTDEDEIGLGA